MIYLLVCMFTYSCCIVIGAFVSSREGKFCNSTPDGGARSQFRELSPFRRLKHGKLTGSLWYINYLYFQIHPSACYFMHYMVLLLRDMLVWPPSLRTLSQFIFVLCDILLQNDLKKGVSYSKENIFSKWIWWRVITLITFERDDQGLPGLGGP